MPIKASCTCGFIFAIKDEFAGKRVKCPKCSAAITIGGVPVAAQPAAATSQPTINRTISSSTRGPNSGMTVAGKNSKHAVHSPPKVDRGERRANSNQTAAPTWSRPEKFNPILDLLDDAGVKPVKSGPTCPNCDAEMAPAAIICVHCGFNKDTGEKLETFSDIRDENENASTFVETDTERLLAKAEREIQNAPTSALNQDFGDGSDSIVVAIGALLAFGIIIVAGVLTVLIMDRLQENANPAAISFFSSTAIVIGCVAYISYVAFRVSVLQGLLCLLTIEYCVVFGFMQGRSMAAYAIIMKVAMIIGAVSGYFYFSS